MALTAQKLVIVQITLRAILRTEDVAVSPAGEVADAIKVINLLH